MDPNNSYSAPTHYHTPHLSCSTGVFSPSQPSSSLRTPQYGISRWHKPCNCVCTCTLMSPPTQWPSSSLGILSKTKNLTPARKQTMDKYSDKENQSPGLSTPPKKQKRAYTKWRTIDEKLHDIFTVIDKAGWSFADFLFYAFCHKDDEEDIHCEQAHANTVQKFLAGYTEHTCRNSQLVVPFFGWPPWRWLGVDVFTHFIISAYLIWVLWHDKAQVMISMYRLML